MCGSQSIGISKRGVGLITSPTVLILGAGASAHVGYPLGSQLVSELCALRGNSSLENLPAGWTSAAANDFLTRLSRSGHYSIDAFLETVPEHAALGKYLIARELKRREVVDALFPPHSTGSWYQYLLNVLLRDTGAAHFHPNSLEIITFNNDRSLEAYLHHALQSRFRIPDDEAATVLSEIPIVHVHGILGSYPAVPYIASSGPEELLAISQQIQIIHEIKDVSDGFCNEMFERANGMLKGAERIFFLGFGFHSDNVRRFRFFTPESMAGRVVKATTSGTGAMALASLAKRLEAHGFPEVSKWANGNECNNFFGHVQDLE